MATNLPGGVSFWDALGTSLSHPIDTLGSILDGGPDPGYTFGNVLTGRLTQDQVNSLKAQETVALAQAGADDATIQSAMQQMDAFIGNYQGGTAESYISSTTPLLASGTLLLIVLAFVLWRWVLK